MTGAELNGKAIVVACAGTATGLAIVADLARAGASVVAVDERMPAAQFPDGASFRSLELKSQESWGELAEDLRARIGQIHGLVNVASLGHRAGVADVTLEEWDDVLAHNVIAAIYAIQALHGLMPPNSSVVNVGSALAYTGFPAVSDTTALWALRGVTRSANLELGQHGVRVNAVHPGFFDEPNDGTCATFNEVALRLSTLGRLARLEDVAAIVRFLMSDASGSIAGVEIPVDCGATSHGGSKLAQSGMAR